MRTGLHGNRTRELDRLQGQTIRKASEHQQMPKDVNGVGRVKGLLTPAN